MGKGKNHGSKRVTLHQKYKIQKKVREHHRKLRKEEKVRAKKQGLKVSELRRKKDPGIPNLWPFKEQLLREVEDHKERVAQEKQREALERKRAREKLRKAAVSTAPAKSDESRPQEVPSKRTKTDQRTLLQEDLHTVMEKADVIIEVLDARDPLGTRSLIFEKFVKAKSLDKQFILVLNKVDLVPKDVITKWIDYFINDCAVVVMKCSTVSQQGKSKKKKQIVPSSLDAGAYDGIGENHLLQFLKQHAKNRPNNKGALTIGVVGFPNVGKKVLIDALVRARNAESDGGEAKVVVPENDPSGMHEIYLEKNMKLLGRPGRLLPSNDKSASSVLSGFAHFSPNADPLPAAFEIVRRCDKLKLMRLYKTAKFSTADEFFQLVAKARTDLAKAGQPDPIAAARSVIRDWIDGKIPFYHKLPAAATAAAATAGSNNSGSAGGKAEGSSWNTSGYPFDAVLDAACAPGGTGFTLLETAGTDGAEIDEGLLEPPAEEVSDEEDEDEAEGEGDTSADDEGEQEGDEDGHETPGAAGRSDGAADEAGGSKGKLAKTRKPAAAVAAAVAAKKGKGALVAPAAKRQRTVSAAAAAAAGTAMALTRKSKRKDDSDSDYDFNDAFKA